MPDLEASGTLKPTFVASAVCSPDQNPMMLARDIVKTGEWDMGCLRQLPERSLTDLQNRLQNVVRIDGFKADQFLDRYEANPAMRHPGAGDEVQGFAERHDSLRDPGIMKAVHDFADGSIDRAEADRQIQERLDHWSTEIPAKMEEIRHLPEQEASMQMDAPRVVAAAPTGLA